MNGNLQSLKLYLGFISTFPPRGCGVGKYNYNELEKMIKDPQVKDWGAYSIVRDKKEDAYTLAYPASMRRHIDFEIDQDDPKSFDAAGDVAVETANEMRDMGIFSGYFLQHEFGLYGKNHARDDSAVSLLKKLNENNIATVTILHTVETISKEDPLEEEHKTNVMKGIIKYTDKAVCISPSGIKMLMKKYKAPRGKFIHIPHGVPEDIVPESREELKARYDFAGRKVFTSFGHISPGKGLEYAIDGLVGVLKGPQKDKDPVYFIAGATHEEVAKKDGDAYWKSLVQRGIKNNIPGAIIEKDGLMADLYGAKIDSLKGRNLIFLYKLLEDDEISEIIKMSDAGVVINLNKEQYSSGPGSQWTGGSRITIGTESVFFKDLEQLGVGLLVPFKDPEAITDRMNHILGLNKTDFNNLEYLASDIGSLRTNSLVAQMKLNLMKKLVMHRMAA